MPDRNDDLSATDLVASAVSERLQLSGERDRLKTLLMDDLRSHGWTETMYKCATKAAVAHQVETEHETMGTADDGRRPLSAQQLAQLIAKQGHDNVPDSVRARLLQKIVPIVREFMAEHQHQTPSVSQPPSASQPTSASQPSSRHEKVPSTSTTPHN